MWVSPHIHDCCSHLNKSIQYVRAFGDLSYTGWAVWGHSMFWFYFFFSSCFFSFITSLYLLQWFRRMLECCFCCEAPGIFLWPKKLHLTFRWVDHDRIFISCFSQLSHLCTAGIHRPVKHSNKTSWTETFLCVSLYLVKTLTQLSFFFYVI